MPSEAKSRAARENGRKSRGPITPEGKSRSSRTALKHGLAAETLVLTNENPDAFDELAAEYHETLQPTNPVERDLVNDMVVARWRLRRAWDAEAALINNEMDRQYPLLLKEYRTLDEPTRTALAMRELADSSGSLSAFVRYEMRYRRAFSRALNELLHLRSARAAENEILQNEPTPAAPPPPTAAPQPPTEPAPVDHERPDPPLAASIHDPQSTFHDPRHHPPTPVGRSPWTAAGAPAGLFAYPDPNASARKTSEIEFPGRCALPGASSAAPARF